MQTLKGRYGIYKKPPKKPIYKENSAEAKKLFLVCENELEKQIAKLIFIDGYTADEVAYEVGYSERQIYRIKKKLKARRIPNDTTRSNRTC